MEEKICSFFGHRELKITDELYSRTACEITRAIEDGCLTFYFGGYGEFDELCYNILTKMKEEKPEIKRIYCVAQERYLHKNVPYFKRENYDEVIYLTPAFDGWYKSIYFRNCAMIDKSDVIIFCAEKRENSGAYKAYKYAKRTKGKNIINLYKS